MSSDGKPPPSDATESPFASDTGLGTIITGVAIGVAGSLLVSYFGSLPTRRRRSDQDSLDANYSATVVKRKTAYPSMNPNEEYRHQPIPSNNGFIAQIAQMEAGKVFQGSQHLYEISFKIRTLEVTILFAAVFASQNFREMAFVSFIPILFLLVFDVHILRWSECLRQMQIDIVDALLDQNNNQDSQQLSSLIKRTDVGKARTWCQFMLGQQFRIILLWHISVWIVLLIVSCWIG